MKRATSDTSGATKFAATAAIVARPSLISSGMADYATQPRRFMFNRRTNSMMNNNNDHHRVQLQNLGFVGRRHEQEQLRQAWQSCIVVAPASNGEDDVSSQPRSSSALSSVLGTTAAVRGNMIQETLLNSTTTATLLSGSSRGHHKVEKIAAVPAAVLQQQQHSVALVTGASGLGKSALVAATFASQHPTFAAASTTSSYLYCTGKFLQVSHNRPWQAILDALDDLCAKVAVAVAASQTPVPVQDVLCQALGSETGMLVSLLPSLALLCHVDAATRGQHYRTEFAFARLKEMLGKLLRVMCGILGHTVVMLVDDVQWADASSVSIFEALTTLAATPIPNLLLVLAYRDDEVVKLAASANPLQHYLYTLQPLAHIHLREMSIEEINDIVARALDCRLERSLPLASVIHRKTNGNVFFAISLLQSLYDEGLLNFSLSSFQWQWDEETILAEVDVSTNLVDLLVRRFAKLPSSTQKVLMVGAGIGTRFNVGAVQHLLGARQDDSDMQRLFDGVQDRNCPECQYVPFVMTDDLVFEALQLAVDDNLLDHRSGSDVFKFAHDQIQQAIYMLMPDCAERYRLHLRIGHYFYSAYMRLSAAHVVSGNEHYLLLAVDQMNRARVQLVTDDERLRLAQLNLDASKVVASLSAFESALAYCKIARSQLADMDGWVREGSLMLETANAMGSYLYAIGNYTECQEVMYEILSSTDQLADKTTSYVLLVRCAVAHGRLRDCVELGARFMQKVGVAFHAAPSRKILLAEHRKIKQRTLCLLGNSDLLDQIPTTSDAATIAAMDILTELTGAAYALGDFNLIYYCGIRMAQISVDRGICQASPSGFTLYGSFLADVLDEFKQGFAIGQLGIQLCDRIDIKWQQGRAMILNSYWFGFFGRPLHLTLNVALKAHNLCMEDGDVHYGCLSLFNYIYNYLWAGLPLDPLLEDHEHLVSVLKEYNRDSELQMHYGTSTIVRVLSGRETRQTAFQFVEDTSGDGWVLANVVAFWGKFAVAVYFGDFDIIIAQRKKMQHITFRHSRSTVASFVRFFYLGMANFMLFDHERRRKHLRRARQILALFDTWTKKGNVNCHHMHQLLAAESLRASSNQSQCRPDVGKAYEQAIVSCSRGGFLHHTALANERAALYCLRNDTAQASFYLMRAIFYYREWNANAKVNDILSRYPGLCTEEPNKNSRSGAFYGKSRLEKFKNRRMSERLYIASLQQEVLPEVEELALHTDA